VLTLDAVTVVDQTIEYRVGKRRLAEIGVPFVHGKLAAEHGRAHVQAIVEDFEQVRPILRAQSDQTPVVQDENWRFGEALEEFQVAAVAVGGADFLEQPRDAPVPALQTLAACLMRECTRDPSLP
jgi:hypothetical protein